MDKIQLAEAAICPAVEATKDFCHAAALLGENAVGALQANARRPTVEPGFSCLADPTHASPLAPPRSNIVGHSARGGGCAGGGGIPGDLRRLSRGSAAYEGRRRCVSLPESRVRLRDRRRLLGKLLLLH
jgi:hypothetical protein